ncbi:exonuclease domain-containing protein [Paenibacillus sp. S-38]|uniref:exonuclease domain-containing protein n=1 Tax=Paenibacillus sp. S-38 TaxID=3416710 RepID=UPI003CF592A2
MQYIIYDLEFTVQRKQHQIAEIIEIGAVRVKETDGTAAIVDTFQTFVKPTKQPTLTPSTVSFTGIKQEDVAGAPQFREAVKAFTEWIGEEDYYLCSWGPDDKMQLLRQTRELQMELDWIRNHNNLQSQYSRMINPEVYKQVGLKRALEIEEIVLQGQQHRALDDAYNTAQVFVKRYSTFRLEKNLASEELLYSTELVYSEGEASHNPFGALAKLLDTGTSS